MPEVTIKLKQLHAAQKEVYHSQAQFTVLACGRRFGKTELGKDKIINSILDKPKPYFYLVPTYTDMLQLWDEFLELGRGIILDHPKNERRMKFATGGMLWFFSSESVDRMRGKAYAGGIIDEAATIPNLEYAWDRVIFPALTDHSGWAWFLSSFRGRNYFWQLYNRGQDSLFPDWASFSFVTADNPHMPSHQIELAQRSMAQKAFEEEYLAIPNDDFGSVFRNVNACIRVKEHIYNEPIVFGVDWGRYKDFTVIVVMGRDTKQVYELDRFQDIDWALQRGRLQALYNRWKPRQILAESNSIGEPNIEALQQLGLPVRGFLTTNASKNNIIDDLALSIENCEVGFDDRKPHVKEMIAELQAYEMERLPSGNFRFNAPSNSHDDTVMALALALKAASSGRMIMSEQPSELMEWRG